MPSKPSVEAAQRHVTACPETLAVRPVASEGRLGYGRTRMERAPAVDAVIVSYNNESTLPACLAPLLDPVAVTAYVVDNASSDGSCAVASGLRVTLFPQDENRGFAAGCNVGWRAGTAPYVLFLNPDARLDSGSLESLRGVLEREPAVGIVGPRIVASDGSLDFSQRRFPRLRSTYAQALFVHRLLPSARWVDELVTDPAAYDRVGSPDWVSGACLLIRRELLERLDGWDEDFFMYCEDKDLCRRARDAGYDVRFDPFATCIHTGGVSAPRPQLLPVLATSRIRYAAKHEGRVRSFAYRVAIAIGALTHIVAARGGVATRRGHLSALRRVVALQRRAQPT